MKEEKRIVHNLRESLYTHDRANYSDSDVLQPLFPKSLKQKTQFIIHLDQTFVYIPRRYLPIHTLQQSHDIISTQATVIFVTPTQLIK